MQLFFRFLTVGVFNTVLGYSIIFACMYLLKMSAELSNVAGYIVGLIGSYLLNRNYTFNSSQKKSSEMIRFLIVFIISYASNFMMLLILIYAIGVHEGLSQVIAGFVYIITSFILNKYYVFKMPSNSKV